MKSFLVFLFILAVTITPLKCQTEVRPKIQKIADELKGGVVDYADSNGDTVIPKQYKLFLKLKKQATIDELYILCNSTSSTVRCYSFWALTERDTSEGLIKVLLNHLIDSARVREKINGKKTGTSVSNFFYTRTPKLSINKKIYIDSIFLYQTDYIKKMYSSYRDDLLSKLIPDERYYNKIRELVIEEKYRMAFLVLSKYHKQKDVELISQLIDIENDETSLLGFQCIVLFPDTLFIPKLEVYKNYTLKNTNPTNSFPLGDFYCAVASYKNEWARDLMLNSLKNVDSMIEELHYRAIRRAYHNFPIALYSEIEDKLRNSKYTFENYNLRY